MCGFVVSLGDVSPLIFRLATRDVDAFGGDGAGMVYFGSEDNILQYKFTPAPTLGIFTHLYNWLNILDIGTTHEMFLKTNVLKPILSTKYRFRAAHTRKQTMGAIGLDRTQPFVINNSEDNITYVVCHKGTIYNYKLIAVDLELGEVPLNDSHMVALAISQGKEAELAKLIEGIAIVLWYQTNKPEELFTFCVSDDITYSPDLFFLKLKNGLLFSTVANPLIELKSLLSNKMYQLESPVRIPVDKIFKISIGQSKLVQAIIKQALEPELTLVVDEDGELQSTASKTLEVTHRSEILKLKDIPQSFSRLAEHKFLYYLKQKLFSSEAIYDDYNKLVAVLPTYVSKSGSILEPMMGSNGLVEYYKLDDSLHSTSDPSDLEKYPVYKVYFYKGLLMLNEACAERAFETNVNTARVLQSMVRYPIQIDLGNTDVNFYYHWNKNAHKFRPLFSDTVYELVGDKIVNIEKDKTSTVDRVYNWELTLEAFSEI